MTIIRNSWRYRIFFFIILEIKESFHKIDLNGDGRLSRRELMKAAAILGMNPTDKDIDAMMKDVDKNSTSKLQITSFTCSRGQWLKYHVKSVHSCGEPSVFFIWFRTKCESNWLHNVPNQTKISHADTFTA